MVYSDNKSVKSMCVCVCVFGGVVMEDKAGGLILKYRHMHTSYDQGWRALFLIVVVVVVVVFGGGGCMQGKGNLAPSY